MEDIKNTVEAVVENNDVMTEAVKKGLNSDFLRNGSASLNEFYIDYDCLTPSGEPCIKLRYRIKPQFDYEI